jgi:N-acetylglucosaminyldiphosphoundecaprenol N-acetyl-beta-D-mannosaminyltransferase
MFLDALNPTEVRSTPAPLEQVIFPDKRRQFFGSHVDLLTMDETLAAVEEIIQRRVPTQHVVINVAKLVTMRRDEKLREIVNSCPLINADGQGIVWGARAMGIPVPERVTGIDLFQKIVETANDRQYRIFFLGAREAVVRKVAEDYCRRYPSMQLAGYHHGYYAASEEQVIVEKIRASKPDALFVAMSSPKKEFFLKKHLEAMEVPFVMGVGGSFDIVAGVTRRAPVWMQKAGLEWFYRILNEPGRMFGRYLKSNLIFLWMMMKASIFGKKRYGCF